MTIESPTGELVEARIEEGTGGPVVAYGSGESYETFTPYLAFVRSVHLVDAELAEAEALRLAGFASMSGVRELLGAAGAGMSLPRVRVDEGPRPVRR